MIKTAKKIIGKGNKIRPVMNNIVVKNGVLEVTNLDILLMKNTEAANGVYSVEAVEKNIWHNIESNDISADYFPNIKCYKSADFKIFDIEANVLIEILKLHKFASSPEDPAINCVRLENKSGKLTAIATDTFRMIKKEYNVNINFEFSVSIPVNTCEILLTEMKKDDNIMLGINESVLRFEYNNMQIYSKNIQLAFPSHEKIYNNFEYIYRKDCNISAKDLKDFEKITSKNTTKYGVEVDFSSNKINIKAKNERFGTVEKSFNCTEYNNTNSEKLRLNVKMLADAEKIISIQYKDKISPVLINGDYLIMPLRLAD